MFRPWKTQKRELTPFIASLYGFKNIDVKNMCTAKDKAGEQVEWSHSTMFVQPLVHVWKFYEYWGVGRFIGISEPQGEN